MKKFIYLSFLVFILSGCEKEENLAQLDGTYSGTQRTLINNKEKISDFEVHLSDNRFITNKGGAGLGPFKILNNEEIKFTDELYYTADFDWNTLLNGNYNYEIKGDSLLIYKSFAVSGTNAKTINYYQYRLKKIK